MKADVRVRSAHTRSSAGAMSRVIAERSNSGTRGGAAERTSSVSMCLHLKQFGQDDGVLVDLVKIHGTGLAEGDLSRLERADDIPPVRPVGQGLLARERGLDELAVLDTERLLECHEGRT